MEVAELTARLVADVALFNQNMESADATIAQAREAIGGLERDLASLKGALDTVDGGGLRQVRDDAAEAEAALKGVRDTAAEADVALKEIEVPEQAVLTARELADELKSARDAAIEAKIAARNIQVSPDAGAAALEAQMARISREAREARADAGAITPEAGAAASAEALANEYNDIRNKLLEIRAIQSDAGVDAATLAKLDVDLATVTSIRDKWIEVAAAADGSGPSDTALARGALKLIQVEATLEAQRALNVAEEDYGSRNAASALFAVQSREFGEPVRTETGAIPLSSGDTLSDEAKLRSLTAALDEYARLRQQVLSDQRSEGGGLVLPNVSQSTIGGLEEYERLQREILDDQRSAGGGIQLGPGIGRVTDDIQTIKDLQEAQRAYEASKLDAQRGPNGAIQLGPAETTSGEVIRAQELAATYDRIRNTLVETGVAQAQAGVSDTEIAKTRVQIAEATDLRDKWAEAAAASKDVGPSDTQIAKAALYAAEVKAARDAASGGGGVVNRVERDAAGGGGGGSGGGGLLAGVLPGGRRASAGAVLTLAGLGLTAVPAVAPAAVALGAGLTAGVTSLIGAAATLKLAFADISKAAFTSQKAFDALTPAQQNFVQQLRTIDYGFTRPLEQAASAATLPGLTAGLQNAITPASGTVARQAVSAFGGAIGGGAQDLGSLVGSLPFARQLGPVLQADAGYIKDFLDGIGNLIDAIVRLQNAAIPLTNWLDRGALAFTHWIDASVRSAQASGQLAGYFNKAEEALQGIGALLGSVGNLFGALFGAIGFQSSLGVLNVFRDAIQTIADIVNQNKAILHDFFAGAVQSATDLVTVVRELANGIRPLLQAVNGIANAFGGWRIVIDAIVGIGFANVVRGWATALTGWVTVGVAELTGLKVAALTTEEALAVLNGEEIAIGVTAATTAGEVGALRFALLALGDGEVLAILGGLGAALGIVLASAVPAGPGAGTNLDVPASKIAAQRAKGDQNLDVSVSYDKNGYYITQQSAVSGARRIVKATPQEAAAALGISVAQLQAQSAPKSTSSTGFASGSDITTLPKGLQEQLAVVQNETGAKQASDRDKLYAGIRAYYDALLAVTVDQTDRTALLNARAGYVNPGGTTPPPLGDTRTGVLPVALQTAIDQTAGDVAAGGPKGPEITALNNAIAYVNALKHKTDADYQERTSLYTQLASLQKAGAGTSTTGVALLPAGLQTSLANAQAAAAGQSAVAGTFNAQNLQAQQALRAQDLAGIRALNEEIAKQAAGSKELRALDAERLALRHEALAAEKQITEELKSQRQAAVDIKIAKIFGVNPDGTPISPGVRSLQTRERQILLEDAKSHGIATAGLVNEPLGRLVRQLAAEGALPKSSVDSLQKINAAIKASIDSGTALSSTWSALISSRLTQINDTLKIALGYQTNYRAPSAQALAEAVPGFKNLTHDQQVALIAGFAKQVGHHGTAATGGAVAGVPLAPNGEPLAIAPAGPSAATAGGALNLAAPGAVTGAGKQQTEYVLPGKTPGLVEAGNLDLLHRQVAHLKNGMIATVHDISIGIEKDGKKLEVLIPEVINGHLVSAKQAIAHYRATGDNLGSFSSIKAANAYAEKLHLEQAAYYGKGGPGDPQHPPTAVTQSGRGDIYVAKIEIRIDGSKFTAGEGKKIAEEIRSEMLKTARRNPLQTKGPNAGRRLALN